jgi:crotonobetainyl-CoA:carnitine CoA-transferase CaiB-like acyl-CoA transferase
VRCQLACYVAYCGNLVVVIVCKHALGEHNVPILTRLGYTKVQIQELKEKNVI